MLPRRILAAVLFALILFGGFKQAFVWMLFGDVGPLRVAFARLPDRNTPEYPLFLRAVAERTKPGERIAIFVPMRHWNGGYAYAYYRASYFLAGRRIIPVVDPDDSAHLDRFEEADWIASWRMDLPADRFDVVWKGHQGRLARGRR